MQVSTPGLSAVPWGLMRAPLVLVVEDIDWEHSEVDMRLGGPGDMWLLGTFSGQVETAEAGRAGEFKGLSLQDALSWARARSGRVVIRLGDGTQWSAGPEPVGGVEPWPQARTRTIARRRPATENWKDRQQDDPMIRWAVEVWLMPNWAQRNRVFSDNAVMHEEVRGLAATARPERWNGDEVHAFLRDIRDAPQGATGWTSYHQPRWSFQFTIEASTREAAIDAALRRLPEPLPDGWEAIGGAQPAQPGSPS
jgi:hypothetical protein